MIVITIRIYYECEDGIEKSVTRNTDGHHEACRVITNGDREGRFFLSHPRTNNGFFSCSPLNNPFFTGKNVEKAFKNLNTLICDMVTLF